MASLLDGISSVLGAMAAQPGLLRLFPGLSGSATDVALAQWAQCGALGGMPIRALGSESVNAALPWAPEFCGWATTVMGVPLADARLPLPAAAGFLATLRSSACPRRTCALPAVTMLTWHDDVACRPQLC